jgi:hypothetical protein
MAIDTDSASATASAVSAYTVGIGSGSHGPTYVSRRRCADRSRSSARLEAILAR